MIICENTGKVTVEGKFPCAVYRKDVAISSICSLTHAKAFRSVIYC